MSEHAVMPIADYVSACDTIRSRTGGTEVIKSGDLAMQIETVYYTANSAGMQIGKEVGYSEGYNAGINKGFNDGYADGYTEGESVGYNDGYSDGASDGYNSGYTEGEHHGYSRGYTEGETEGIKQGKQAEYDAFWDNYQVNGTRTHYDSAFAGDGWYDKTIKPKYKCVPTSCASMFSRCGYRGRIKEITPDIVDFSQVTSASSVFTNAEIGTIEADFSACKSMETTFSAPAGTIMTTIKVKMAPTSVNDPFYRNVFLENLIFLEGSEIKCKGYSFQYCTNLTKQSFINIINVLSATTSGLTITLPLSRIKKVFETSSGANDGNTSEEWLNLIATKPNWTINLV